MRKFLKRFALHEKGATIIEYGLLAAVIAIGLISIWQTIGFDLRPIFQFSGEKIQEEVDSAKEGE